MIEEFELLPVSSNGQSGGSQDYILQRRMRILKIFVSLMRNKAVNDEFKLLKSDGSVNEAANIAQLLELTQSKNESTDGLEDFVNQLVKANIDLSWIVNTNIKEKIRASKEKRPKTTTITESEAYDEDDDDDDENGDDEVNEGNDGDNVERNDINNEQSSASFVKENSSLPQSSSNVTQPKSLMSNYEAYKSFEEKVGKIKSKKKRRKFTPYKSRLSPIIGDERYDAEQARTKRTYNKKASLKRKLNKTSMTTRSGSKRLRSSKVKWQTL